MCCGIKYFYKTYLTSLKLSDNTAQLKTAACQNTRFLSNTQKDNFRRR